MKFAIDGLGMQCGSRVRGIGRYLRDLVLAVAAQAPEPFIVYGTANLPTDGISEHANIVERILPGDYTTAIASVSVTNPDNVDWLVIGSPFETHAGFTPPSQATAILPLATIAYDLIPLVLPHAYLTDRHAAAWRHCLSVVKDYRRFLTISHSTTMDFQQMAGIDRSKITTIGAACNHLFFQPGMAIGPWPNRVDPNRPFILYLGQPEERKNWLRIYDVFRDIPRELRGDMQLVIVCPLDRGRMRIIQDKIRSHDFVSNVVFLDRVSDHELLNLYRGCSVFCFPSLYEGFGLPLLEAMACGAPCVAGNNSSQREVAGDAALLVDAGNTGDIAGAIIHLLTEPALANELRREAPLHARTFNWRSVAWRLLAALKVPVNDPLPIDLGSYNDPRTTVPRDTFPEARWAPDKSTAESYWNRIDEGLLVAAKSSLVVCGLMRDIGDSIHRLRQFVEYLGAHFRSWKGVFYENDSVDGTAAKLLAWANDEPRIMAWTEYRNLRRMAPNRDPKRGDQMAEYRNMCHDYVAKHMTNADYVLVVDTDLAAWSTQGILSSLGTPDWDMMGANGLRKIRGVWTQYDAWAWRDIGHPHQHHYLEVNPRVFERSLPPVPVLSCFGGMGLYRMPAFLSSRYAGGDCEHVILHRGMAAAGFDKLFCNPGMMALYSLD
jgi:glycosyltransferase involved in cell wall biosynthesis